jgi:hypothetical protein
MKYRDKKTQNMIFIETGTLHNPPITTERGKRRKIKREEKAQKKG